MTKTNHTPGRSEALLISILVLMSYGFLSWFSFGPIQSLSGLVGIYLLISLLVFILFRRALTGFAPANPSIILGAIIIKAIGLFTIPFFEDDYFRFLLDGCVFWNNGTPYGISPQSITDQGNSHPCYGLSLYVNYPDLSTIYPPILQGIFALSYAIGPGSLMTLKLIFLLFEICLLILLSYMIPRRWLLLIGWHPVFTLQMVMNVHPDIIGIVFLTAAICAFNKDKPVTTVMFLAAACVSKIFALLAAPFILLRLGMKSMGLFFILILLVYAPFIVTGATDLSTLGIFAKEWQFNSSIHFLLSNLLGENITRILLLAVFGGIYLFYLIRSFTVSQENYFSWFIFSALWIYGAFFLLSPVVNAWYLCWLLPFACMTRQLWPWVWATLSIVTFITGLNLGSDQISPYEIPGWLIAVEYLAVIGFLVWENRSRLRSP